jgi:hypothetical protein
MSMDRVSIKYVFIICSGLALSACSRSAATAVPPVVAAQPPAATTTAAPVVTGLPDFTALVEHYGPAVVKVQVAERRQPAQTRGPQGIDPNDPSANSSAASASRTRTCRTARVATRPGRAVRDPVSSLPATATS